MQARISDDGWIRCKKCGRKLGRVFAVKGVAVIEIKCHSCKSINVWSNGPEPRKEEGHE